MSDTPVPVETTAPPHSPRQVLLGLFILFQLGFLFVSNFLGAINWVPSQLPDTPKQLLNRVAPLGDKNRHGWHWSEQVQTNLSNWAQVTGQDQAWSLFAPGVSKQTGFPAVMLLFDDPPTKGPSLPGTMFTFDAANGFHLCGVEALPRAVMLLSDNEPADVHDYIRFGKSRLRRYEGQFYINPQPKDGETEDELASRLTQVVRELHADYRPALVEYLKWKRATWKLAHPDEPAPKQVILMHRLYRICEPKDERGLLEPHGWEGPLLVPMIRGLPAPQDDNDLLLEPFDFTDQRFTR